MTAIFNERTSVKNRLDVDINPATIEKQNEIIAGIQLQAKLTDTQPVSMAAVPLPSGAATETTLGLIHQDIESIALGTSPLIITNAIDQTSFVLNISPFSATTNISNDYIFDSVEFNFTTSESKTITITTSDGTLIYSDINAQQNILLPFDRGFNGGENLTVAVTQTSGACLMDCVLKVKQGSQQLAGNPVLGASNEVIGQVNIAAGSLVNLYKDYAGKQVSHTIFNEIATGRKENDILVQFQYNIATYDVTTSLTGSGTVTQSNSQAVVSSGAIASSSASVESIDSVRYRPGHEAFAYFTTVYINGGVANSTQRHGIYSSDNGFYFGYNGTSFGVGYRNETVDTWITQSNFNKDKLDGTGSSGFILNPTKMNIYKITYGWLGSAPVYYEVFGGNSIGWIVCHVVDFSNSQTGTSIGNPVLPIRCSVTKTAGSTDIVVKTGCWAAGVIDGGSGETGKRTFAYYNTKAISAATVTNIFTLKNNTTFQSKTNRVVVVPKFFTGDSDGAKSVRLSLIKNATLGGSPSYTSIDATNSVISYDTAGTTVTGGTLILPFFLAKVGQISEDLEHIIIKLKPGETLTVSAYSAQASDIDASISWEERF